MNKQPDYNSADAQARALGQVAIEALTAFADACEHAADVADDNREVIQAADRWALARACDKLVESLSAQVAAL